VMLHRAILGSLERFIGILLENHAGALPLWLAPRQIAVAAITSEQNPYVETVVNRLKAAGLRAESDLRADKISYKIRELSLQKLPYIAVVGAKEAEQGAVAVRGRGNVDLGVMSVEKFIELAVGQNRPGAHLNN
jgi:threonyl-tRNA synthetase